MVARLKRIADTQNGCYSLRFLQSLHMHISVYYWNSKRTNSTKTLTKQTSLFLKQTEPTMKFRHSNRVFISPHYLRPNHQHQWRQFSTSFLKKFRTTPQARASFNGGSNNSQGRSFYFTQCLAYFTCFSNEKWILRICILYCLFLSIWLVNVIMKVLFVVLNAK